MQPTSIEDLYKWQKIKAKKNETDEKCFLEEELKLTHSGIRTRVILASQENEMQLKVPLKDSKVAQDIISGEVVEVVDVQTETYHVFERDLSFKNDRLYEDKYHRNVKSSWLKPLFIIAILLGMLLVVLRFVNFS
ncbi:hypothetical protein [Fusibacter tunisiensis]|uniref:Uncharacterized protein n=1 Tax=Fusibacter tunisiensis TaxID=1008308 RepID=A0ABS2MPD8_9FIRM|nr:hypothetical protein [Fusibacter tunisiensis]MBM7561268.1 hypothetical protein [Fusibacter tunisiensis]